jgi:hypothetical protein
MTTSTDYLERVESGDAKLLNANKAGRGMLYRKLSTPLGLSEQEKDQFASAAGAQQNAAVQAQAQQMSQAAMASGPQYAGQFQKGNKDIMEASRQGQAAARGAAEEVSAAKAINDYGQIVAMTDAQRDRVTQKTQFYTEQLFGTAQAGLYGSANTAPPGKVITGGV